MKFLVIGGAGYVGSHFVWEALRHGHEIAVYDNLSRGHREFVPQSITLFEHDILETARLIEAIQTFKPDCILHYAAFALVKESVDHPELYTRNNVQGTESVLKAISKCDNAIPLVFSSSCAVYGIPDRVPITENTEKKPLSPYGDSKLKCEQMIDAWCTNSSNSAVALRYFNACGADASGDIGERHDPETHLIPNVMKAIKSGDKVTIFGNDYKTTDGTCVRDYIHVTDLALAHLAAADRLTSGSLKGYNFYNLGTGIGLSNLEILQMIEKVTGTEANWEYGPRRAGDPDELVASANKAEKELGFRPRYSDLETVIRSAWAWETKSIS